MSRYYRIEIDGGPTYTSFENGKTNPSALQVELDIPVAPFASPAQSGAFVKVWGVPLSTISQAQDLRFKGIKVYGGFQKGLPLANPAQSGLLVQGYIFPVFGNWIGTDQSLDLIVAAGPPPLDTKNPTTPRNLTINWKQGQNLSDAIKSALGTAYSGYSNDIKIDQNLKLLQDETAYFSSLEAFARYVKATSKSIIKKTDYPGVDIILRGTVFNVFDGSAQSSSPTSPSGGATGSTSSGSKVVAFQDLIGQPTWIEAPFIQFKTMMRADIQVGDQIPLPKTLVTNSAQAQASLINQQVSFQGKFQISSVRHVGSYRQPTADAWVTIFEAFPLQVTSQ